MKNISGVFAVSLGGVERDTKCTFGAVEKLERHVWKKPLLQVLNEAVNGQIYLADVVSTICAGLEANRDTRLSRDEVGQMVMQKGLIHFAEWYVRFLTYAVTGEEEPKLESALEDGEGEGKL